MKKIYTLGLFVLTSYFSFGQVPIAALNATYTENFDGMGATGTTLPTNWSAIRFAGTATPLNGPLTVVVGDGSANSGAIYNMGVANATERSIGSLASGGTVPAFGVNFVNNTGGIITELNIIALVRQWRLGSDALVEKMPFAYSTNATSLFTGTWTNVTSLDATEIQIVNAPAAPGVANIDGTLTANQATITATVNISATPWANNATLWVRWIDENVAGSDCALAIDNFRFKGTSSVLTVKQNQISGLSIYPNPVSNGNLFVTSDSNEAKNVLIFDVLGKKVLNANVIDQAVNVSNLNSGVYFVKVTENGKTATRKLVINN